MAKDQDIGVLIEEVRGMREAIENGVNPKPLTRKQAAAYLQVHPDTVYRWAVEGQLAYSKLGDGEKAPQRFMLEDLNEFACKRRRIQTNEQASPSR